MTDVQSCHLLTCGPSVSLNENVIALMNKGFNLRMIKKSFIHGTIRGNLLILWCCNPMSHFKAIHHASCPSKH